ncbi:carboxypeptidase-like regulatory domain-containing protein [Aeoliella sp. ICT_H6.2]|uniref:Carboxypeptidase-like regulatory domain-containing protein n=1 Tax=Aeoliella straminimaris TaxID=2954799 RepID=A0A9X2JIR2_9BACT|nr:carboxypeptidase-like regulatory domain-containing protein [Aeoliella straminimaris]MCO6047096.1 carboxypeptidase-like regulatory domain-containing protein [Aeoliella straminimaris]
MAIKTKWLHIPVSLLAVLALVAVAGCSDTVGVSGNVTVDGQPLPYGHIGLQGSGSGGERFGAEISNGKYSIPSVPPGKYEVTITGEDGPPVQVTAEQARQGGVQAAKELITLSHPKNGQTVDIVGGRNSLDFDY